ncbi:MAG TPA: hypothetical protein VKQ36_13660, partial [Ktedonobacterales bacterium]|nr:hypothetical protein [Ktedonobacterales bacterium]
DARKAGLVPILALELLQQDQLSASDSPQYAGAIWSELDSGAFFGSQNLSVGQLEQTWFDSYTDFAVEYATLSQKDHLPYFIIGDSLTDVSYDTDKTNAQNDSQGVTAVQVPGESFPNCVNIGRRDCEWRHVIHAIRSVSYDTIANHQSQTGASYTGKLIYLANWGGAPVGDATTPEFEGITWWDAVDYIGIDAYFPLTANNADVDVTTLTNAWHGQGVGLGLSKADADIYSRIQAVSKKFNRPVIFQAGYASSSGANNDPSNLTGAQPDGGQDNQEQLSDMQALLQTFNGASWWEGVFWNGDEPQSPRSTQSNWPTNSNWAGDTLATSKPAGQYLNTFYQSSPLQCSC